MPPNLCDYTPADVHAAVPLNVLDKLPDGDSGKTLSDFTDSGSIASYAQEAMTRLVEAGVVGGNNGYLLPEAATTRAQMAQVLYHILNK